MPEPANCIDARLDGRALAPRSSIMLKASMFALSSALMLLALGLAIAATAAVPPQAQEAAQTREVK